MNKFSKEYFLLKDIPPQFNKYNSKLLNNNDKIKNTSTLNITHDKSNNISNDETFLMLLLLLFSTNEKII